jgi:hypothetical protein
VSRIERTFVELVGGEEREDVLVGAGDLVDRGLLALVPLECLVCL